MALNTNSPLQDKLRACETWSDLEGVTSFEEAQAALLAREHDRVYRKLRNQKEAIKDRIVKDQLKTNPKFKAAVDAELAKAGIS